MKTTFLFLLLIGSLSLSFYGCESDDSADEAKEFDPRKPAIPDVDYYGDSVYIVSKHIDTVYSFGQWMDRGNAVRKHRKDSIQRAKGEK